MLNNGHHIGRLTLDIETPNIESALQLRARAEDIAWKLLPNILERVFDALAPDDMQVRIDRLDLDLGAIATSVLEQDLPIALERVLTEALTQAIANARYAPSAQHRVLSPSVAMLDDFETYLVHGTIRFRQTAHVADPAHILLGLISQQPAALADVLRRHSGNRQVIERLVLQAGDAGLHALLGILVPHDVVLIVAYLDDIQRLQERAPTPPLAEPALRRVLWTVTLEYLLCDAGTQFNRRTFLASLLEGLAEAEGIAYSTLLVMLQTALARTRERQPLVGSLPGVLDELLRGLAIDIALPTSSARQKALDPFASAEAGDFEPLLNLLRRSAAHPQALDLLVRRMKRPMFAKLIERLEPVDAGLILACLADLTTSHHQKPWLALSKSAYERQLRLLVLRYLLHDPGTQFNRVSWLRRLLEGLAAVAGVSYAFLLTSMAEALLSLQEHLPPSSSLPGIIVILTEEQTTKSQELVRVEGDDLARLIVRLQRHAHEPQALSALVQAFVASDFERLFQRLLPLHASAMLADMANLIKAQHRLGLLPLSSQAFERSLWLTALRVLLSKTGQDVDRQLCWQHILNELAQASGMSDARLLSAPHSALIDRDPVAWARRLAQATAPQLLELIRQLTGDVGLLQRSVSTMDEAALKAVLGALNKAYASEVLDDLHLLWARHRIAPLIALDLPAFQALTWALAFSQLAHRGDGSFHRAQWRDALLEGLARHDGIAASDLGSWRRLMASVNIDPPSHPASPATQNPLLLAERYLRTGQPLALGARLSELAASDQVGFSALLRRLMAAGSGQADTLIERLWDWMLPEEIVAALLPGQVAQAVRWAGMLADMPGASMASAWRQVLEAACQGHPMAGPSEWLWPGERLDRMALLRHWMDGGTLAWWAPADASVDALVDELSRQPLAQMQAWLGDADLEQIVWRLRRVHDRLGTSAGLSFLKRLAPWAFSPGGPLAGLSHGLSESALRDLRIRAAAVAMMGLSLDLAQLTQPILVPPDMPVQVLTPPTASDRQALFGWLSSGGESAPTETDRSWRLLAQLIDRGDAALDVALREGLGSPDKRVSWAVSMPEELLARVIHHIAPSRARFMLDLMTVMRTAWRQTAPPGVYKSSNRTHWCELLAVLAEPMVPEPRLIVRRLLVALQGGSEVRAVQFMTQAQRVAQQGGYANVIGVLRPEAEAINQSQPQTHGSASERRKRPHHQPIEPKNGDVIYVRNAGLVLLNPFLPRFFEYLEVLQTDHDGRHRVVGEQAASIAVHSLQYLVDEQCDAFEPDLVLNKLLCGVAIDAPVARSIHLSNAERSICHDILQAVIGHWPIISSTSAAGLRETFLQREGRLLRSDDRWTLTVQRKTVDVLVDQIPWGYSIILHSWMDAPLYVTW